MATPLSLHLAAGQFQSGLPQNDAQAVGFGLFHPGIHVGGLRHGHPGLVVQESEFGRLPVDELFQGPLFHIQIVLGGDFLGSGEVVAGLGLMGIGDGGGPHLETLPGLGQLFGEGLLLGLGGGQGVLGLEHVEIGRCHPQQQILLRQLELLVALEGLELGLLVALQILLPVEGLDQGQGETVGGVAVAAQAAVGVGIAGVGAQTQGGQQAGLALGYLFLAGVPGGTGGRQLGVVFPSQLVDVAQIGGIRQAGGEEDRGQHGPLETVSGHVQPRNGSWTRPMVRSGGWLARRDDAACLGLQGGATKPDARLDVPAGA